MLQSEGVYRVGISEWLSFFKWDRNIVTLDSFSRTAGEHVWMVKKGFIGQWRTSLLSGCCLVMPKILEIYIYIYAYISYWRLYIPLCVCVYVCICTCRHLKQVEELGVWSWAHVEKERKNVWGWSYGENHKFLKMMLESMKKMCW